MFDKWKNVAKMKYYYRKGRCRNGSRCKFAHDSDVKAENLPPRPEEVYDSDAQISSEKSRLVKNISKLKAFYIYFLKSLEKDYRYDQK